MQDISPEAFPETSGTPQGRESGPVLFCRKTEGSPGRPPGAAGRGGDLSDAAEMRAGKKRSCRMMCQAFPDVDPVFRKKTRSASRTQHSSG